MKSILFIFSLMLTVVTVGQTSVYDIKINDIDGKPIKLEDYKGKKIMFVNVASKCGYTWQYKELQELYDQHKDDLMIIGVPCNQFGKQEPGTNEEIVEFCEKNFGVTFLITEKVKVKGDEQHALYKWLTSKELNGKEDSNVKWNFQKYLINEKGEWVTYFPSKVNPLDESVIKYFK